MTLQDSWRQLRTDRKEFLNQNQQQVSATLESFAASRAQTAQSIKEELKASRIARQHTVRTLLADISADRQLMAQQIAADLRSFRIAREAEAEAARVDRVAQLQANRSSTQALLTHSRQTRLQQAAIDRQTRLESVAAIRAQVWSAASIELVQIEVGLSKVLEVAETLSVPSIEVVAPEDLSAKNLSVEDLSTALELEALDGGKALIEMPELMSEDVWESEVIDAALNELATDEIEVSSVSDSDLILVCLSDESDGMRLSDIETLLNLSRAQVVSSLGHLISQKQVVQRDRRYYMV